MNLAFDDVLLKPKFSNIDSRKDVDVSVNFLGKTYRVPIISSNMDTVTSSPLAISMIENGATSCLHRFQSIESNVNQFKYILAASGEAPMVSVGLGKSELERAEGLRAAGAEVFIIDVAHGASALVAAHYSELRKLLGDSAKIVVGNFSNKESMREFIYRVPVRPDAWKIGIGGGSACITRQVTGCGQPTLHSILDCKLEDKNLIADGGIRTSGDMVKALAAGAQMVMVGRLLAAAVESAAPTKTGLDGIPMKLYRGSASQESYEAQGKVSGWRTAEGESYPIPVAGSVSTIIQTLESGLRSGMSYVGAHTLEELVDKAEFQQVTLSGYKENGAYGKDL